MPAIPASDDAALRDAGLRVTAPRLAVLGAVRERPHATVEEIAAGARERAGAVSTQAVYDVLRALATAGLARRIEPAGSAARFELRVGDNHHHVVCRVCGAVADVDCAIGHAPCLVPDDAAGYVVDEADVTYWGICPACQAAASLKGGGRSRDA
ncbi:MAG: Fur family transcriptional regulator, stress-responsive regulator [Solirubrobacteraceae bacterium]|jgi:Fur family ferric uptake transcriptional regulator|nr:Fur family transcriptional regulator, stress-responsive regulator [Solirubrobacteraceae bacterium]